MKRNWIKLLRAVLPESGAHMRARLRRAIRRQAERGCVSNWLEQGRTGFDGRIS